MSATIPAHLDCPTCPACGDPCGTEDGEAVPRGWLVCAACGHEWEATAVDIARAKRADAAYAKMRDAEEADASTWERMPERVRAANLRMLEALAHRDVKPDNAEQLDLLGGLS